MISYDALCEAADQNNWLVVFEGLRPKQCPRDEAGNLVDKRILAKIAEILTSPSADIPKNVRIIFLKCLINSCVEGYEYEKNPADADQESLQNHCHKLYRELSTRKSDSNYFPYDGIIQWSINTITKYDAEDSEEQFEIVKLCFHFLCNLLTFTSDCDNFASWTNKDFQSAIIDITGSEQVSLCKAAYVFLHNTIEKLKKFPDESLAKNFADIFVEGSEFGFNSEFGLEKLLRSNSRLIKDYDDLKIETKLCLLEILLKMAKEKAYSDENKDNSICNVETVKLLSEKFKRKSDLILKTVDSYLDGLEPREITLLLDILSVISSQDSLECNALKNDKSLLINCIFLLKSLHMAGKESSNYFTPVQRLSEVAPSGQSSGDIQEHPAFGFKAGLIRVIGNLIHGHKENQDLVRETDALPLLLDCCNIDARNPLIMQWTILALRNACVENPENQEIIRNCNRICPVDNEIIREMGIKLHEEKDGKAIGILPLPRKE